MLTAVVKDKLNRFLMGFESQLFSKKAYVQAWFISKTVSLSSNTSINLRSAHFHQGGEALPLDEQVHQVSAHIRHVKILAEEAMMVSRCQGRSRFQGMFDGRFSLFCWSQFCKNLVQTSPVRCVN
jgi:hypothetical protein